MMTSKLKYLITLIALTLCCGMKAQLTQKNVNVGVMLPLHDVDGDGRRMVESFGVLIDA